MNEEQISAEPEVSPPSQPVKADPEPVHPEQSSQLVFIEEIVKKIPLAVFNEAYRLTPQGLFVDRAKRDEISQAYREWLKSKNNEEISDEKLTRKLFGSEMPTRYYLLEGKKCLSGYFVPAVIQNPPQYRVPYYLGSPNSASDYLHTSDPIFTEVQGVRSHQSKAGMELVIAIKDKEVTVPLLGLRYFMKLARASRRVAKFHPQATESLSDAARALIHIITT